MAENVSYDVVNQVQSADAPASVDVSASTIDTPTAPAVTSSKSTSDNTGAQAAAFDKPTDGAISSTEHDISSGRGQQADEVHPPTPNGMQGETGHSEQGSGEVSAPPSVGQSVESEDATKQDASDGGVKADDQLPRYSVKKPSSFKPVSVTKSFLAKAGTPPAQVSKPPPEPTPSTSTLSGLSAANAARPRLVAKTASGHKLSMSTQLSSSSKLGQGIGPDPLQVWNRNRVQTPQATPKHLTDEELRQQYGIQLASIPTIEGDDKGNKWADIDDEEDDWAPEVIEWSDGSKVNLAEAEKAAADKIKTAAESKQREDSARAAAMANRTGASLGPKATVLKVGGGVAQAKTSGEATQQALKPTDKPTLVAKPVVPTQVKSPWAQLPPMEKVSPLPIDSAQSPSAGQPTQQPGLAEQQMPDRGAAPWRLANPIAADDFSRASRDYPNGTPRELFNSQSGKYEPVSEGRRGSFKREQNYRQTSVLQRPGPDQDSHSTMRRRESMEHQAGSFAQRRPSITQQGYENRMQGDQPEAWHRLSGSWVAGQMRGGPQSPGAPLPGVPAFEAAEATEATSPNMRNTASTGQTQEDVIAVQKKLMIERREAARKRRLEEEAKEEAERKERIRKKLEALGPAPEKKEVKSGAAEKTTEIQTSAPVILQKATDESKPLRDPANNVSCSPPKPPVPTAAGPQQYGMMKVHPSPMATTISPAVASTNVLPPQEVPKRKESSAQRVSPTHFHQPPVQQVPSHHKVAGKASTDSVPGEPRAVDGSNWNDMTQASKAWERAGDVNGMLPNGNMWAPPGGHKALGNGDFNISAPRGPFRQTQTMPEAILPSPQAVAAGGFFGDAKGPSPAQAQGPSFAHFDQGPHFGSRISPETKPQPPSTQSRTPALPSPLAHGHPAQQSIPPAAGFAPLPEPRTAISAWANFGTHVHEHDAAQRAKSSTEHTLRVAEAEARGEPVGRSYNETWKQVMRGDELGTRQVVGRQTSVRTQAPQPPSSQNASMMADITRQPPVTMPAQHPRASRFHDFFGHQEQGLPAPQQPQHLLARPASPPMPPPDSAEHPVFEKVGNRPLVNLPGLRPKLLERPIVKLPPSNALPRHPVVPDLRGIPPPLRGPAQPLAKTLTWQHRFDGLFNKAGEKRALDSSDFSISKVGFDILSVSEATAVSFPQPGQISPTSPTTGGGYSTAKTIDEEEALFDGEQVPGSTPPVRVPVNKYPAEWSPATTPHNTRRGQLHDLEIFSRFIWIVGLEDFRANQVSVCIKLPGSTAPAHKQMSSPNVHNPKTLNNKLGVFHKGKPFSKNPRKPRDPSAQQTPQQSSISVIPAAPPTAPPAPAVPQTWAKRVSAAR